MDLAPIVQTYESNNEHLVIEKVIIPSLVYWNLYTGVLNAKDSKN